MPDDFAKRAATHTVITVVWIDRKEIQPTWKRNIEMKYKPKLGAKLALLMRTRFAQKQKPELKYSRKRKHKEKEE